MARKPRKKAADKAADQVSTLLNPVRFIALAQTETGAPYQTHCRLDGGWITATNGILSAGHPIPDQITACPHTHKLLVSLSRAKEQVALSVLENNRLYLNAGHFRAHLPSLAPDELTLASPDPNVAAINDRVKDALAIVGKLLSDTAQTVIECGALLQAGSCVGTNRKTMLEAWHGFDLPPDCIVPKTFIAALAKVPFAISGFGYTPNSSVTFWYENGAWLKTQLYQEQYPDYKSILDIPSNPWGVPEGFFAAVAAVAEFSDDGSVILDGDCVRSHSPAVADGAVYQVAGLPKGRRYEAAQLLLAEPHAGTIDLEAANIRGEPVCTFFSPQGDDVIPCRGIIMGLRINGE